MTFNFARQLVLLIAFSTPALASAQSVRSSHVIIATVQRLPDDGTVAVLKRFADPRQKDVIFLDSRGKNKKSLNLALVALRHLRFATPTPDRDVTVVLKGAKSGSASMPAAAYRDGAAGKRMEKTLSNLSAKNSLGPARELRDAFLQ
jgi:hypothetical protein